MIFPTLEQMLGKQGAQDWKEMIAKLPTDRLYHGTSLRCAETIQSEGFRARFGRLAEDHEIETFWGPASVAASFAIKRSFRDDSPPVILSATLLDVIASGEPQALRTYCDDAPVEYASWQECLEDSGSLWILGGRYVSGMRLHQ